MIKEACRILLTLLTLGIVCKTKGVTFNKDLGFEANIYHNNNDDLIYQANPENNWNDNDGNIFGKINTIKHGTEELSQKNEIIKLGAVIKSTNNGPNKVNQLQQDKQNKIKLNSYKDLYRHTQEGNSLSNSEIFKRRRDYAGHFRPGRKSPLSYLHISKDTNNNNHFKMYNYDAKLVNEDLIRRFTGTQKRNVLPICDINESLSLQGDIHRNSITSDKHRRDSNFYESRLKLKINSNHEGLRKMRSQWPDKYNSSDKNNVQQDYNKDKNKSPLDHSGTNILIDINNDNEKSKLRQDKNTSIYLYRDINHNLSQMNPELAKEKSDVYEKNINTENKNISKPNDHISNSQVYKNMNIVTESKRGFQETQIINNSEKNPKSYNKAIDNLTFLSPDNKNLAINLPTPVESVETKLTISYENEEPHSAQPPEMVNNLDLIQPPTKKEVNGDEIDHRPETIAKYKENNSRELSYNNTQLKHNVKNKIQASAIVPLASMQTIAPNISYIYLQPIPVSNSLYFQKGIGISASSLNVSTESSKVHDSIKTMENKSNDLITISIDPKTLQNKILHAEFFKKSDVKKTPDMLTIELSPKDTLSQTNSSKQQKTVSAENALKISASVKNNTIVITNDDKSGSDQHHASFMEPNESLKTINNNLNRKIHLKQYELLERPEREKLILSKATSDRQKKSISSMEIKDSSDKESSKNWKNIDNDIINQPIKKGQSRAQVVYQPSTPSCLNLCGTISPCLKTTLKIQNFKEIHEGIRDLRKSNDNNINLKENPLIVKEDMTAVSTGKLQHPTQHLIKIKRQAEKMNISKLINILKPVFILSPKDDNEGSEADTEDNSAFINKVNLKGSSEVTFEKGNKKVENKILEGFINSIIANYSKEEGKLVSKETTTDRTEDGVEPIFKLLENNIHKRIHKEALDDKRSDLWNLTPILVPESSISKYSDSSEYAKWGPFDESAIKSFLKKDSIPLLEENVQVDEE